MRAKQKIVQGRGPSNINLGVFVCSLMFAGLHNQFFLLTMLKHSNPFLKKRTGIWNSFLMGWREFQINAFCREPQRYHGIKYLQTISYHLISPDL